MLTSPVVDEIIEKINGAGLFTLYVTAIRGFGKEPRTVPISKITFSVTPEENKTTYFQDENAMNCVRNDIRVRLNVYAPTNRAGEQVNALTELVMDYLSEIYIENLKSYRIGDLTYDDNVNALNLPCYMELSYTSCLLEGEEDDLLKGIPDNFFCKSHVNDSSVHLSEADREYINSPIAIGTYTGDGDEEGVDIELGFRPKAVLVFRSAYHIASYNNSEAASNCYFGAAVGSTYTRGVLILNNGFRVKTVVTSSATTHLNDSGGLYGYIAFR